MVSVRRDESGSLMILSGLVITMAFIMTALTLAQVAALERDAASDRTTPIIAEWRFMHDRLATNLDVSISEETEIMDFEQDLFPRIVATFRTIQAEKGYDTVIRLAGDDFPRQEEDLLDDPSDPATAVYTTATTLAGDVVYDGPYDLTNDGIIWSDSCPVAGSSGGCIVGVYVFVRLADTSSSIEETILFKVNWA